MNTKIHIIIIEDEKNICNFMATTLSMQGYKISTAANGKNGLSLVTSVCPDLILLDLGLPDIDGIRIIREIRTWASIPIIVISARTQEQEKVLALDSGADDYITKPFGPAELMARIRTALRHGSRLNTGSLLALRAYQADGLVINFEKHLITLNGEDIHLTQVEYKIVSLLAQNSGRVMTYDSIISNVWGPYADDNNRILRVNMANIRRKLEKNPAEPHYIFTEIGIGYRMLEDNFADGKTPDHQD